ncbi:glycosyltransferase WbuB [Gallionella capsiferriformans]|uniref:Glycosyl transferase group 1 n=1 Tax=Gallionella capsiferriformans (strain ES-2) TaxID=395494 RepID=D9SFM1_GALCS|nr:glycosyltransferase WbuB [Gallionella capsiferriformans]ADL55318.1 glycosyl transferase group 1 [Gallionella capsiferriformans ES-2]
MRILIHGINFFPEQTGIGKYSGEIAEWLVARGYEVRVVTAPPYYPQWRIADGYPNGWCKDNVRTEDKSKSCEVKGGSLAVYRCPLWVPAKPSGLKRVLHLASFALSSFPIMLWQILWRPDVVWVVEPPLFCAPQAWLVARLSSAKSWLHIQDYEVDAAFDLGLLKGAALRGMVAMGERWLMRRFDRVSTISPRMLDRALAKGVAADRAVLFPNWVDLSGFRIQDSGFIKTGVRAEDSGLSGYRVELGIAADAVVALYSGNMGGKQGLEILAQAAELGSRGEERELSCQTTSDAELEPCNLNPEPCNLSFSPDIVFVFCGNGAGRTDLVLQCKGLPNVRFMDLQPLERLGELLSFADIHLLPQRADAADLVMPSKLTGMLASGRPVVATANMDAELANVVAGCGLVVEPEQPQAFFDAINTLARDAALRDRLGAAGRSYAVAHLDRDAVLGRFEAELKKVVNAGKSRAVDYSRGRAD